MSVSYTHLVAAPGTLDGPDAVDVSGKYVTPGFVDIHIHGSKGSDFCDAGAEHIETMSAYLGGEGVTAFCGTTMAFDEPIPVSYTHLDVYKRQALCCQTVDDSILTANC